MEVVATAVGGLGMDLLNPQFLPRPVVAEFHFSTQGLLSLSKVLLLPAKTVDRFVDGTIRQGGEPHDSRIQSHGFAFQRCRFDLGFNLDRHVPPPAFAAHGEVSQRPVHDTTVAVAHPSEFRQEDTAVRLVQFELVSIRDAERLPTTFALEPRRFRSAGEKVGVRPIQILDGLLQGVAWRIPQPCGFRIRSPGRDLAAQGGVPVHPAHPDRVSIAASPMSGCRRSGTTRQTTACVVPATRSGATGSGKPCGFPSDNSTLYLYRMPDEKTWQSPCIQLAYSLGLSDAIPTGGIRFPRARCPSNDMRAWGCRFRIDAVAMDGATNHVSRVGVAVRHQPWLSHLSRYLGLPYDVPRAILPPP